jgi:hypothetical protein
MLDKLPLATIAFLAGIVLLVIGYADDRMNIEEAFKSLLYLGGATGAIGYVRNQAGKGLAGQK